MNAHSTLVPPALLLLAIVLGPAAAHAWGSDGHRIVGEIAYQNLEDPTRQKVLKLLPNKGRYRTLYEASTWADTYARGRDEFEYLKPHHFVNGDPSSDEVRMSRCGDDGCVVSAIISNACVLRSSDEEDDETRMALFLLAHFVGDVHQPLHVAHPDGRGGNRTYPRFFGDPENLHKIWDTLLIEYHLATYEEDPDGDEWEAEFDEFTTWDVYAGELANSLPDAAEDWDDELDPIAWANESLAVSKDHAIWVKNSYWLGQGYYEKVMPQIALRLQAGGVRLAALLNAIYGGDDLPFECED